MSLRRLLVAGLVVLTAGTALIIWMLTNDRTRLAEAQKAASQRTAASLVNSRALPVSRTGSEVDWSELQAIEGGAFVLGHARDTKRPVLMAIDLLGAPTAADELPADCGLAHAVVPISAAEVVFACSTDGKLVWLAARRQSTRFEFKALPSDSPTPTFEQTTRIRAFAHKTRHFWIVETPGRPPSVGTAEGPTVPQFSVWSWLPEDVSMAPADGQQLLLVHEDAGDELQLSSALPDGTRVRTVSVTQTAEANRVHPRVVFDGSTVGVFWVQPKSGIRQFPTPESWLMYRLFNAKLEPLGPPRRFGNDPYISHLDAQAFANGVLIVWDQGVRGSWHVPTVVQLSELAVIASASAFRLPFKELPFSTAIADSSLLAFVRTTEESLLPDRVVTLRAPEKRGASL